MTANGDLRRTIPTWTVYHRITGERLRVDERTYDPTEHTDAPLDRLATVTHPVADPAEFPTTVTVAAASTGTKRRGRPPKAR